ncbi:MAG: VWA domain-containing protein [Planctomycetaceae bacterium]|jgi:hypothetical protein|nr:VWA domain-containing protein [Planctomycetaceae bacterium]
MKEPKQRIKNRKLPAWIGSILLHAVLVLIILIGFAPQRDRSAPGDRIAVGSIVLQSSGGDRHEMTSETNPDSDDTNEAVVEGTSFSTNDLSVRPPTPALAPGPTPGHNADVDSTTDAVSSFESISGGGIGNLSGETTVQIFGTNGKGTKFMYVFDRSGSMESQPLRRAKDELIRSLDSLNDFHQFNIVFYSAPASEDDPGWRLWRAGRKLIYASQSEKLNAVRFVDSITAEGGTRHFEPLSEAIRHRPDVIFFLTDGESQDDLTPVQLANIERANSVGKGTQINVIQFGSGGLTDSPSRVLRQLAEENNGQYQYVNVTTGLR